MLIRVLVEAYLDTLPEERAAGYIERCSALFAELDNLERTPKLRRDWTDTEVLFARRQARAWFTAVAQVYLRDMSG